MTNPLDPARMTRQQRLRVANALGEEAQLHAPGSRQRASLGELAAHYRFHATFYPGLNVASGADSGVLPLVVRAPSSSPGYGSPVAMCTEGAVS